MKILYCATCHEICNHFVYCSKIEKDICWDCCKKCDNHFGKRIDSCRYSAPEGVKSQLERKQEEAEAKRREKLAKAVIMRAEERRKRVEAMIKKHAITPTVTACQPVRTQRLPPKKKIIKQTNSETQQEIKTLTLF